MSKQRNIRKSKLSFEEEDDQDTIGANPPAAVNTAQRQRAKDAKTKEKKALLSFEDDVGGDDESGFIVKKSSSRNKGSLRAPGSASSLEPAIASTYTQLPQAGEYSVDRLRELHLSTLRAPGSKQSAPDASAFKLQGSFKPPGGPSKFRPIQEEPTAAALHGDPYVPSNLEMPLPPPSSLPPPSVIAAATGDDVDDEAEDGDIPNQDMIKWAKAKRERLRTAHRAPDYISTSTTPGLDSDRGGAGAGQGPSAEAGPSPTCSSGAEGDLGEDTMRIKFMGAAPVDKPARGTAIQDGGEDDGDDFMEEDVWVEEQIRKGLGGSTEAAAAAAALKKKKLHKVRGALEEDEPTGRVPVGAASASQAAAVASAADGAMAALQTALQRAQVSQRQAEKNLASTHGNLENSKASIIRAEKELKTVGDRYAYVQQLRAYVSDLCNMLQEKSPLVEELEEELLRLREGRAQVHAQRCKSDDAEEHTLVEAVVQAALGALSQGATLDQATAAAAAEELVAQRSAIPSLPPELDEFGRDVNYERRAEMDQRAKQRSARIADSLHMLDRPVSPRAAAVWREPHIGAATTDESEGEVKHYLGRRQEVVEAAGAVFRDAAEEFSSVEAIKARLEEWKNRYSAQYRDAYVALSVPAIFAPFVRLELLQWAPLDGGEAGFDSQAWYKQLFDYGMPADAAALDPEDPDGDLVPRLVGNLVLPLARALLEEVWNPYSRRQSKAAATMLADLLVYLPPDNEDLHEVVKLVQRKLDQAVEGMEVPTWPPAALAASKRAEMHVCHRFCKALRLLHSVCAFEGSLARSFLVDLAVDRLIDGKMVPYVRAAAATPGVLTDRAARILAALPSVWLQSGPPRGLQPLLELLRVVTRPLEGQAGDAAGREANSVTATQLAELLYVLADGQMAARLKTLYGIQ